MTYSYDTLVSDIVANMEEDSDEFLQALPSIVSRAQGYLQRRVDSVNITRFDTISVSASVRALSLPTDLLVLKSLQVETSTGTSNLIQQTNEYLTAYWPIYTNVGVPKYYAAKDNLQVYLAPTPAYNTLGYVEYVPKVTVLSATASTNWFSENASEAFFNCAMMYANMWAKNASAITAWKTLADEELTVINNEARRARRSDTSDRSQGVPENNIAEGAR